MLRAHYLCHSLPVRRFLFGPVLEKRRMTINLHPKLSCSLILSSSQCVFFVCLRLFSQHFLITLTDRTDEEGRTEWLIHFICISLPCFSQILDVLINIIMAGLFTSFQPVVADSKLRWPRFNSLVAFSHAY